MLFFVPKTENSSFLFSILVITNCFIKITLLTIPYIFFFLQSADLIIYHFLKIVFNLLLLLNSPFSKLSFLQPLHMLNMIQYIKLLSLLIFYYFLLWFFIVLELHKVKNLIFLILILINSGDLIAEIK